MGKHVPLKECATIASDYTKLTQTMPAKKKRILVIEDESMLQSALIENLTDEGYNVTGCANAEEAFEQLKEEKPDIILTDLILPNIDGFEIIKVIKENLHLSGIPVLVLSNQGEDSDIERAKALGAQDFLVKANLSLDEISKRVKKALDKKKSK